MTTTKELLIQAKALIDTPEKWTQGELARNKHGGWELLDSPNATCFCSIGAIRKTSYDVIELRNMRSQLVKAIGYGHIAGFNDSNDHATVMATWDKAIANCDN